MLWVYCAKRWSCWEVFAGGLRGCWGTAPAGAGTCARLCGCRSPRTLPGHCGRNSPPAVSGFFSWHTLHALISPSLLLPFFLFFFLFKVIYLFGVFPGILRGHPSHATPLSNCCVPRKELFWVCFFFFFFLSSESARVKKKPPQIAGKKKKRKESNQLCQNVQP